MGVTINTVFTNVNGLFIQKASGKEPGIGQFPDLSTFWLIVDYKVLTINGNIDLAGLPVLGLLPLTAHLSYFDVF
jgi:hypothetical protein